MCHIESERRLRVITRGSKAAEVSCQQELPAMAGISGNALETQARRA